MPSPSDLALESAAKLHLGEFAARFQPESLPLGDRFSYLAAAVPVGEDDLREYLVEPVAALPALVRAALPPLFVLLVPYLERPVASGKHKATRQTFLPQDSLVVMDPPDEKVRLTLAYVPPSGDGQPGILAFAVKDVDMSEYHFHLFNALSRAAFDRLPETAFSGFMDLLRGELKGRVHGEVDQLSWAAKQNLLNKQASFRGETKLFREYARESFFDTLTLYLHGLCCDIDVEPGPRQIASRHLRKRLEYLRGQFPPPEGYAVFPEELKN
ncbi:MAG: hypothetical protein NTX13_11220 [Acidobacteria bacterium]|jgi:hypothetical protein|nr:hypothetical protein [Acidobacteriota bacterium]